MTNRREFLKISASAAVGGLMLAKVRPLSGYAIKLWGTLDPETIPKYRSGLIIPPAMPWTGRMASRDSMDVQYYEIAVRQFQQQILPSGLPKTTVWSYGSVNHPTTFNYPAYTIEATYQHPVRVKWINDLVDRHGNYLRHLLPVDPTLHWANPPGPRDARPTFATTPGSYTGPVPIVTHVHGAYVTDESDGFAEAWYLPAARNIPAGYFAEGSWYRHFKEKFQHMYGVEWTPGSAMFQYPNDQRAGTFWYHDHTLGLTRVNVFAGPAGFFILRGGPGDDVSGVLPGPAPALGDPPGTHHYEIPLAIQDRAFKPDGSLHYPDSRADFDDFPGPYIPFSDISPIWNPEVFGNVMVVNGRSWPRLAVEPRRYRFRVLNGCNSRFLILKLASDPLAPRPVSPVVPFWQIGAEGGYLPAAVELPHLVMGPAERADVIVDFTGLPVGTELFLINEAPDEPYGGGMPGTDFEPADPNTTGQVMKLVVVPLSASDPSTPPDQLGLPERELLGPEIRTRKVSLNEKDSEVLPDVGPREALLGTVDDMGMAMPMMWSDQITENPGVNDTEIWEIHNHTMDAHPIHIHEIMFEVVNRETMNSSEVRDPEPWETGLKDTVIAYPDEITRVKARFDLPGLYVWHCHIVEHEDNEMMRPYYVGRLNKTWLPNVQLD